MISTSGVGRPVAVVSGGLHNGTVIRVADGSERAEPPRRHAFEVLSEEDFIIDRGRYKLLPIEERLAIAEAIARGEFDEDSEEEAPAAPPPRSAPRAAVRSRVAREYKRKSMTEYRLDDGKMQVLPSEETERVFVAARSGAGKTFWAVGYIREYQEMFPDRQVFLFSTHEDEKAYSMVLHTPIPLDDTLVEKAPTLEDLQNSLCVFDDCDNIVDKKVAKAVQAINANLISNGRKYNIHVMTLSHLITAHEKTRLQLMEANRVVLFPQGGSQYHNSRYLSVYAGLSKAWIGKLLAEPSRWVCLDLRAPMSYVTENAVVVIGQGL